jgi:hypothetical protein
MYLRLYDICNIMRLKGLLGGLITACSLFVVSCQKPDEPIVLPQQNGSQRVEIDMGEDYTDQLFFDFETNSIVYTSPILSWDLAFEATSNGYHVFMNGAAKVLAYNTHQTNIFDVNDDPKLKDNKWLVDASCGLPDSTGIGEWLSGGMSKKEVYILKLDPTRFSDTFKKIQLLAVTEDKYILQYGDLRGKDVRTVTLPKNPNYNYVYFSFKENAVVNPEPPKNTWDIVFTRYRIVYHYLDNFTYPVTGVLHNANNTSCAVDSITKYEDVQTSTLLGYNFKKHRDVIGYDWKIVNIDRNNNSATFTVNKEKTYTIKNRNGRYYKMRFLDYYKNGVKGYPTFEFQRIQ